MASQLTKRGYKYRVLPTNDSDTFNDFLNDDSEFNIKKLDTDLEKLDDKVLLEGKRQQKFDFIESGVAQDGLEYHIANTNSKVNTGIAKREGATLIWVGTAYRDSYLFSIYSPDEPSNGFIVRRVTLTDLVIETYTNGSRKDYTLSYAGGNVSVAVNVTSESSIQVVANGIVKDIDVRIPNANVLINCATMGYGTLKGKMGFFGIYNRIINPNEIQHNFSVLNNSLSISQLHTTDSTGKTSILKLGSNSTHVEMQTGRTLEEEYTSLLGRFGKEIDSPDGSAVQVDNGLSGKVLKMSIKGQTVKNYVETNTEKVIRAGGTTSAKYKFSNIEVGKTYTLSFELFDSTDESSSIMFSLNNGNTNFSTVKCSNGIKTIEITPESQNLKTELWFYFQNTNTNTAKIRNVMIVDSSNKNIVTSYIPFGLSSTEAIISNNGQQYPIYEPTIQGKTRILDTDTELVPTDPLLPPLKDGDVLDLATKTITFANKSTQVLTDEQVKAYSAYRKIITLNAI